MSVSVVVDWQNIYHACKRRDIDFERIFEEISRRVLETGRRIEEIRLFVPNYQLITSPWRLINALQLKFGLAVEVCPVLREGAEMEEEAFKDLVDLSVFSWVTKHLHPNAGPDFVVFVSGDGHFLLAANEAMKRGKEVQFWIVDPETTSGVILRNLSVQTIELADQILLGTEENPFLSVLNKARTKEELTLKDRKQITILRRVGKILPTLEKPTTFEAEISAIVQKVREGLSIRDDEARQAIKALITLGIARLYPVTAQGISVDQSSFFFQWLQTTEK